MQPTLRDDEGNPLMPTEELENALRTALARAAADIHDPEQARRRLLRHDYRPGRGHGRLAAGITAATSAAAVVLGLGLAGTFDSAPARGAGTIQTTAFTLVSHANGTATLTINLNVLLDPATLQSDLQHDGIPALVTSGSFCSSDPVPAGINQVLPPEPKAPAETPIASRTLTIDPAAMPAGTELSFGYFPLSPGGETAVGLIDTGSYTCTSSAPGPNAVPAGADFVLSWRPGTPKEAAAKAAARRALLVGNKRLAATPQGKVATSK
jgi:hypothetical protein